MVIARTVNDVQEWEHTGTTFYIRQLPHKIMLRLESLGREDQIELIVRAGCGGWVNMQGAEAEHADAIVCGISLKDALTEASLDRLPLKVIGEMSVAILKANQLTDDDAGN